jgi:uncharacterized membrane protein
MSHLKLYLALIPVFFLVDLLWLGVIAVDFYQAQIGHLLAPEVDWAAAVAFYLLFIAGIQYFGVRPGLASGRVADAALNGALFGFFTYLTYELTNRATLPAWPLTMVFVPARPARAAAPRAAAPGSRRRCRAPAGPP